MRYGNVIGSRGSIIETLLRNKDAKKVQITNLEMTRFWITLNQSFELVLFALNNMEGGEIFIPKIPSMKLVDLFDALTPHAEKKIIGIRPGEKIHEILLTEQEARHSLSLEKYYVVLPEFLGTEKYKKYFKIGKKIEKDFRFTSDTNKKWLNIENFKKMLNI